MEKPRFQRYDPTLHENTNYLASGPDEHAHARVVSVLTGIFNPVVADFVANIQDINPSEFSKNNSFLTRTHRYPHDQQKQYLDMFDLNGHPLRFVSNYVASEQIYVPAAPVEALVGDYGEDLAVSLVRSGDALKELLRMNPDDRYAKLDFQYKELLERDTFRMSVLPILHEGIQSTVAGLSLLTIDSVEGYENEPLRLCQDIIHNKLLEQFAALIPTGYVFPMVRHGHAFANPLEVHNGALSLSREFKNNLKVKHKEAQEVAMEGSRARGCPAAARTIPDVLVKNSGITLLGQQMLPFLFEEYSKLRQPENPFF